MVIKTFSNKTASANKRLENYRPFLRKKYYYLMWRIYLLEILWETWSKIIIASVMLSDSLWDKRILSGLYSPHQHYICKLLQIGEGRKAILPRILILQRLRENVEWIKHFRKFYSSEYRALVKFLTKILKRKKIHLKFFITMEI